MVAADFDPALDWLERQFVGETDGLQQCAQLVIAVSAPAQDFERPVDFGERGESECHLSIQTHFPVRHFPVGRKAYRKMADRKMFKRARAGCAFTH
jgi:hypothetical protein